jgi:SRSO17 transposase
MIERAIEAGVPFAWVAADTVYGVARSRWRCARRPGLRARGHRSHDFNSWIGKPESRLGRGDRAELPPSAWRRLSAGAGTKGPRLHDWAYLELADLEAMPTSAVTRASGRGAS